MKRALFALGSFALGWLIVNGCNNDGRPDLSSHIRVTNAEVRDWTNPDDGKTYLIVAPSWTNEGPEAVREVTLLVSEVKGSKGKFPKPYDDKDPNPSKEEPWITYRGDPVEKGSTIHASDAKETFAVMGLKDEVLAITGENPEATVEVASAHEELGKEEPKEQQ